MVNDEQSRLASVLDAARTSERGFWWTTFVLAGFLGLIWALATPLYGGPDEPAHTIRAASVVRGQLVGKEVRGGPAGSLLVRAPLRLVLPGRSVTCYALHSDTPASCADLTAPDGEGDTFTTAGRHPPAYYAVAGLPTLLFPSATGIYLVRMFGVLVTAAFVAAAAASLRRTADPRFALLGLAVAATPMVWFVSGIVNPSAPEIAAAIALWASGLVLVTEAPRGIDTRVLARVGVAAVVLALARQLGPLWLGLILVTIAAVASRDALRAIIASRAARLWGLGVGGATLAQLAWIIIERPLDTAVGSTNGIPGLTTLEAFRTSLGGSGDRYRELIGWFGWMDSPPLLVTIAAWTIALFGILTLAVALGRRRHVVAAGAVAVLTIAAPVFFETLKASEAGYFWQGRYTLPLAVGVPMLAGIALVVDSRHYVFDRARVLRILALAVIVGQAFAFGQALRRATVGSTGNLDFFIHPDWSPPMPVLVLLLGYIIVSVAFTTWLLGPRLWRWSDTNRTVTPATAVA